MRVILAASILILSALAASAHGPWPWDCCHDRDCEEIDAAWISERGDSVTLTIPPGGHRMWPKDGRPAFVRTLKRSELRKPVTGEWGVCIGPTGNLLCVFPPGQGT